jgi:NitT/TauT family transport system substrate-binding protein
VRQAIRTRRPWSALILLVAFMLVVAACGGDDDAATTTAGSETTTTAATTTTSGGGDATTTAAPTTTTEAPPEAATVNVRLDFFTVGGYHSPFHVADELGYYAEENLTVNIGEGQGSASTAQLVGSGDDQFGLVVGNVIVSAVAEGIPIISAAQWLQNSGFCVISLERSGIDTIEEMRGKKLANPPFGASGPLLPAFFDFHGLEYGVDIEEVTIDPAAATPSLLEGIVDLWVSTNFGFPPQFEAEFGEGTNCFRYKDAGVDPVGWGLVANKGWLAENEDVARRFIRATMRGWKWTLENPVEAGEITRQRVPTATNEPESAAAHLRILQESGLDPAPRDGRTKWGEHPVAEWENTVQLGLDFLDLTSAPALEDLFTDEYLPDSLP